MNRRAFDEEGRVPSWLGTLCWSGGLVSNPSDVYWSLTIWTNFWKLEVVFCGQDVVVDGRDGPLMASSDGYGSCRWPRGDCIVAPICILCHTSSQRRSKLDFGF